MKYDGVGFNREWVASFATADAFLQEMAGEGYTHIFPGDKARTKKLREVYKLCKG